MRAVAVGGSMCKDGGVSFCVCIYLGGGCGFGRVYGYVCRWNSMIELMAMCVLQCLYLPVNCVHI